MEKLKEFIDSLYHSNEGEKKELLAFSENLLDLINIFEPHESVEHPIKSYHNKLLGDFGRKCLYTFKNYVRNSSYRGNSDSICYLFKEIINNKVSVLRFKI